MQALSADLSSALGQQLAELPPEMRQALEDPALGGLLQSVLGAVAESGTEISSPEDLEQLLGSRPELQAQVEAMARQAAEQNAMRQAMQQARAELPDEMRQALEDPEVGSLIQDIFGELLASGTDPDNLEQFLQGRPELMARVMQMAGAGSASAFGNLLETDPRDDELTRFWKRLLRAEVESGGTERRCMG